MEFLKFVEQLCIQKIHLLHSIEKVSQNCFEIKFLFRFLRNTLKYY